jgi:hypothetical protein
MQDPNPENIMGQKQVSHSVEWKVNVGYTLLAVLGLFLAWKLFGAVSSSSGNENEDDLASGELDEIEVEATDGLMA